MRRKLKFFQKEMKKMSKKFVGIKKVCTFAVPFGNETGKTKIIDNTERDNEVKKEVRD